MRYVLGSFVLMLAACSASEDAPPTSTTSAPPTDTTVAGSPSQSPMETSPAEPAATEPPPTAPDETLGGNRFHPGRGGDLRTQVVSVAGEPLAWIAAISRNGEPSVVAVTDSGSVHVPVGSVGGPGTLPAGAPPLLAASGNQATLAAPPPDASPLTAPALLPSGQPAWIEAGSGDLVVGERRLGVDALPDAKVLVDGDRVLLLVEPTDRYQHAVLGDAIEAAGWAIVDTNSMTVLSSIRLDGDVIEGVSPIWADVNGDGRLEVIVTLSNPDDGARIVVYSEDGTVVASGPPIGRGGRWRHQLAVGPFGPSGELQIATMLTPHIGGVLEHYRLVDGELVSVARAGTFTTHAIGSRNLDMVIAGDFDGNGHPEVVVLSRERDRVIGVEHTTGGLEVRWERSVDGRISTNLAATNTNEGLVLFAGTDQGDLVIWEP